MHPPDVLDREVERFVTDIDRYDDVVDRVTRGSETPSPVENGSPHFRLIEKPR